MLSRCDAKVVIPAGVEVTIDGQMIEPLHWVRVDGVLRFAADRDTQMTVDTLIVGPPGKLDVDVPLPHTARVLIADRGPIDTTWDPFVLSRGLISHGTTEISGSPKTTWTTHALAKAGDTQITVADVTGWQPGDRLVLPQDGVQYANYAYHVVNRDDDVRITAIGGDLGPNVVQLDRPLKFDHKPVEANVPGPVKQDPVVLNMTRNVVIESENPAIDRRGHVMLMHSPATKIGYVAFNGLGRTDKSKQVTDPDGKGGGLVNPRGRYALHLHRTGVDAKAVEITGCAIDGFPGWGLVNHDSNVIADRNVSYGGFGAAFVTELGNEKGLFTANVAARVNGVGAISNDTRINDPGHFGDGFWIEGAGVPVVGNVAIACKNGGFTFFSMAGEPIRFQNNVGLFQQSSLIIWDVGGNGIGLPPIETTNLVEGNFLHGSLQQGYSSRLTYKENTVVAFDPNLSHWGFGHTGVNTHIHHIDNRVVGFQHGIAMPTEGDSKLIGGYYDNVQRNLVVTNTQKSNPRRIDIERPTFGNRAAVNIDMSVEFFSYSLMPAYPRGPYMSQAAVPDWRPLFAKPNSALGHPQSLVTLDGAKLYFEEQGADFQFGKLFTRFPNEIRFEPDGTTLTTTASLAARGLIVGGEPLPEGEQFHLPKVRGVLVNSIDP